MKKNCMRTFCILAATSEMYLFAPELMKCLQPVETNGCIHSRYEKKLEAVKGVNEMLVF